MQTAPALIAPTGAADVSPESAFFPLGGQSTLDSVFAEIFAKLLGAQDPSFKPTTPSGPASTLATTVLPVGEGTAFGPMDVASPPTAPASGSAVPPGVLPGRLAGSDPALIPPAPIDASPTNSAGPSLKSPPFGGMVVNEAVPEFTLVELPGPLRGRAPDVWIDAAARREPPDQPAKPQTPLTPTDVDGSPPAADASRPATVSLILRDVLSWERPESFLPRSESPPQRDGAGWVSAKGEPVDWAWKATPAASLKPPIVPPTGDRLAEVPSTQGDASNRQASQTPSTVQFAAHLRREGLAAPPSQGVSLGPLATQSPDADVDESLARAAGGKELSDAIAAIGRLLSPSLPTGEFRGERLDLTPEPAVSSDSSAADRNAAALARMDRVEFVQRIVQALERARVEFPKSIEVQLNPPVLGKMRIQVTEQNGEMVARIQVESPSARTLLLEHLPNLDRQLGEHGVQIQRFHVDPMNTAWSGPQGEGGAGDGRRAGEDRPTKQTAARSWRAEAEEREPPWTVGILLGIADGMDVLI